MRINTFPIRLAAALAMLLATTWYADAELTAIPEALAPRYAPAPQGWINFAREIRLDGILKRPLQYTPEEQGVLREILRARFDLPEAQFSAAWRNGAVDQQKVANALLSADMAARAMLGRKAEMLRDITASSGFMGMGAAASRVRDLSYFTSHYTAFLPARLAVELAAQKKVLNDAFTLKYKMEWEAALNGASTNEPAVTATGKPHKIRLGLKPTSTK